MTALPIFALEAHFSKWEFKARYHLTASDAESMTMDQLIDLGEPDERVAFGNLWLGYTETWGAPDLRAAIADTYDSRMPSEILCFAGAEEGIFATLHTILDADDHAIVVTPTYQSLESIPLAICAVTGVALKANEDWALDIDEVAASIRPSTKIVIINFPNNPTGAILDRGSFDALIALCRQHGIFLFSDEAYRPLGPVGAVHLPAVADVYERGLSLGVLSKAYGLPGLRVGWMACADTRLLGRIEQTKHYLSICNSGPSERLSVIALRNRASILERNCRIVSSNLEKLDAFFAERPDLFEWQRPDGGCVAFPRYLGVEGVEDFARDLIEKAGVLVLPSSIYSSKLTSTPHDRFRIGSGRKNIEKALDQVRRHLSRTS